MEITGSTESTLSHFSWSGIIAGLFVAMPAYAILVALGLGIGLAAAPNNENAIAIGTLIWSAISWGSATFLGGYVAGWISHARGYAEGLFHGLVTWGVMMSVFLLLPSTFFVFPPGLDLDLLRSASWFIVLTGLVSFVAGIYGTIVASKVLQKEEQQRLAFRAAS